jgi:outer membrane protein
MNKCLINKEFELKLNWSVFVVVVALWLPSVYAADIKIGFVDAERINRESVPAEEASKRLEKEFAPRVQELQQRDAQLKSSQEELQKEAPVLAESERIKREQDLSRKIVELQRLQREYREDLNLRRNQELGTLLERANRIIRQIAESEKYDLVLQEAVYRNPRIDITEKVLKALAGGK